MLSHFSPLQLFATLWTAASRLLYPWDSPGKNTGVGCHALLQGIVPTQESNLLLLGLLYWQVGSLPLVPPGKSRGHFIPYELLPNLHYLIITTKATSKSSLFRYKEIVLKILSFSLLAVSCLHPSMCLFSS